MNFDQPAALLGLVALLPVMALIGWTYRQRQRSMRQLAQPHLLPGLVGGSPDATARWRLALWLAAFCLLMVVMARPQCGLRELEIEQEGVQIMVALDVSASMLAQDVRPSRLALAKLQVIDLLGRLDGDEVGLVLFSGEAYVQLPLTSDYLTARRFLDSAGTGSVTQPGTAVGVAIDTAAAAFDQGREGAKVILLMTDGEDSQTDPIEAARRAEADGITIFAVGFGLPQGHPVPDLDEYGNVIGTKIDSAGSQVVSRLDEETLRAVAEVGGGIYLGPQGAAAAVASSIDSLQSARLKSRIETQPIERFQVFLAVVVLALLVSDLLPQTMRRRVPGGAGKAGSP